MNILAFLNIQCYLEGLASFCDYYLKNILVSQVLLTIPDFYENTGVPIWHGASLETVFYNYLKTLAYNEMLMSHHLQMLNKLFYLMFFWSVIKTLKVMVCFIIAVLAHYTLRLSALFSPTYRYPKFHFFKFSKIIHVL